MIRSTTRPSDSIDWAAAQASLGRMRADRTEALANGLGCLESLALPSAHVSFACAYSLDRPEERKPG